MRKILSILFSFILCINLTGCSLNEKRTTAIQIKAMDNYLKSNYILMKYAISHFSPNSEMMYQFGESEYAGTKIQEYATELKNSVNDEEMKSCISKVDKIITYQKKLSEMIKKAVETALSDFANSNEAGFSYERSQTAALEQNVKQYASDIYDLIQKFRKEADNIYEKAGIEKNSETIIPKKFSEQYLQAYSFVLKNIISSQLYYGGMNIGEAQMEYYKDVLPIINNSKKFMKEFKSDGESKEEKAAKALYRGFNDMSDIFSSALDEITNRDDKSNVVMTPNSDVVAKESYNEYLDIMGMSQERYKLGSNNTEIKQEINVDNTEDSNTNTEDNFEETSNTNSKDQDNVIKLSDYTVRTTSRLAPEPGFTYYGKNAKDGNINTCWAEGVDGPGIGEILEYITFELDKPVKISGVKIVNGCCNSKEAYYNNNRVKEVRITAGNIDKVYTLKDEFGVYQDLKFDSPDIGNGTPIAITIESVYPGNKYDDTCIAEFQPY